MRPGAEQPDGGQQLSETGPACAVDASTFPVKPTRPCAACGRPTSEPRRGRCWGCYFREHRGREVDQACACCGTRDRRVLGLLTLADGRVTTCGNCARVAGKRKLELEQLRAEVFPPGDRRASDRRVGDRRDHADRRQRVEVEHLLSDSDRRDSYGRRSGERLDTAAE